jgi:hypothetical protein
MEKMAMKAVTTSRTDIERSMAQEAEAKQLKRKSK